MKQSRIDRQGGFSLLELMVVVGISAVIAALAVPSFRQMSESRRLGNTAITLAGALTFARSEAIRTGNIHIVFVQEDANGDALEDADGNPVPILVLDDGRPGSTDQNCDIDTAETVRGFTFEPGVSPGVLTGTSRAPADLGTGDITTGSSFKEPDGDAAKWVLFRPEGLPFGFDSACTVGAVGSGAGSFYLHNGDRSTAIAVSPMGNRKIQAWQGSWSQ